ncbi:unnamed protein product [marine sediment metagenome]|uniref:Uncharacterized protein n=1 Tax=marine sediment metagenome TaxID=412755 RepID=X0X5T2_9ZZZZ
MKDKDMREILRKLDMTSSDLAGEYYVEQDNLISAIEVKENNAEDYIYRAVEDIVLAPQTGKVFNIKSAPHLWTEIGKRAVRHFGITSTEAAYEIFNAFYEVNHEETRITVSELIKRIEMTA